MSSKAEIKLIVFAGNPGQQYRYTRHNAGTMILEALERRYSLDWSEKFGSDLASLRIAGRQVRLIRPGSFMNKIGEPARKAMDFFNLDPEEILVVHDELELPFGTLHFRRGGGLGGHNGLRSLKQHLGTDGFSRLRFGISRPPRGNVSSWVLARFSAEELPLMEILTDRSEIVLEEILKGEHNAIINKKMNLLEGPPL